MANGSGKYAHLLEGVPTAAPSADLGDDDTWLDQADPYRSRMARYTALAAVISDTAALDPERARRSLRLIGEWQRPLLAKLHELADQRERAMRPAAQPNGRAHAEVKG